MQHILAFGIGTHWSSGGFSWHHLQKMQPHKTLQQIADYGQEFLSRLSESATSDSTTFADGLPVSSLLPGITANEVHFCWLNGFLLCTAIQLITI